VTDVVADSIRDSMIVGGLVNNDVACSIMGEVTALPESCTDDGAIVLKWATMMRRDCWETMPRRGSKMLSDSQRGQTRRTSTGES
jgi:hypothetical protein